MKYRHALSFLSLTLLMAAGCSKEPATSEAPPQSTETPPAAVADSGGEEVLEAAAPPAADPVDPQPPVEDLEDDQRKLTTVKKRKVRGKPADMGDAPGEETGYWLWQDDEGWHLRTTSAQTPAVMQGRISSPEGISGFRAVRLESKDRFRASRDDKGYVFSLRTGDAVDGFDFEKVGTSCLRFFFRIDGEEAPGKAVRLGAKGKAAPAGAFAYCGPFAKVKRAAKDGS
ncbi:MAG: hypothetical protein ACPGUV_02330 [Polyangiales bacterium]